ncbi:hypothetical protein D9M72_417790 [compost metagenome]
MHLQRSCAHGGARGFGHPVRIHQCDGLLLLMRGFEIERHIGLCLLAVGLQLQGLHQRQACFLELAGAQARIPKIAQQQCIGRCSALRLLEQLNCLCVVAACAGQKAQAPVARALLRRGQQALVGGFGGFRLAGLAQRVGAHTRGVWRDAPALLQSVDMCQRREP